MGEFMECANFDSAEDGLFVVEACGDVRGVGGCGTEVVLDE